MTSLLSILNPVPYFPPYKGPYEVGTLDLEVPVSSLVDAGLSPPCPAHSDIPTVQFRVFYPAALKGKAEGPQNGANWVPSPRKEYVAAYCRFAGAGEFLANVLSYIPRHLYYIKLPVHAGHQILQPESQSSLSRFPVVVFSHGLGGTRNTYSYLTASLASQGAVVFCPEHRDGSAPATFIREPKRESGLADLKRYESNFSGKIEADGVPQTPSSSGSDSEESAERVEGRIDGIAETKDVKDDAKAGGNQKTKKEKTKKNTTTGDSNIRRIDYTFQSHEISAETAAIRHKQLEIRLWELGALYAVIQKLDKGWDEADIDEDVHVYPSTSSQKKKEKNGGNDISSLLKMFENRLALDSPGSVTWMGHSFGGATITQFVKSCWYAPLFATNGELEEPLYTPSKNLLNHFHQDGTINVDGGKSKAPATILLDTWCLPLLGKRTRALWKLPLPGPTMGILSWQFFKWKENLRGFRHVMNTKGGSFESEWFKDVEDSEQGAAKVMLPDVPSSSGTADEIIPQVKKLHRSSSLDVTPQLPRGIRQDDEAKIEEEDSEESAVIDDESLSLYRTQSYKSQKSIPGKPQLERKFYYAAKSAHMSQSDFGVLFPRSARYLTAVDDSEGVLDLNVRAVIEFMREQGAGVAAFGGEEKEGRDMEIFGEEAMTGWERVSLELGDEGVKKEVKKDIEKGEGAVKSKEVSTKL
ncbi:hypothetical protein ABW20_dc0106722 [Dactylellina cionopaga]|nr:hypothetical protein ABW20_dc0106722 [Dactylellina cionopaga]